MIKKETYTESALHDRERLLKYKTFAVAFSYPEGSFFDFFPDLSAERNRLTSEYDRLFRAKELWLYGTEHMSKSEFQRANYLSDIMGFYRAFGVEPEKDRADLLTNELEFMHYLIFKRLHAFKDKDGRDAEEKASISLDAQKKFFIDHLYPAAKNIANKIISLSKDNFYIEIAEEMLEFLECEKTLFTPLGCK